MPPIKKGREVVSEGGPGLTLTVRDVNGKRLDVNYKRRSWIERDHVVPFDQAIDYLTRMVERYPSDEQWRAGRAAVWMRKGELDIAIADYTALIRLSPDSAAYHNNRGNTWSNQGDYDQALADYSEAIRLDPKYANVYNGIAWLRPTCSDGRYRDGAEAIRYGEKACDLTGYKEAYPLDTLAAAYAENGQYDKAVETQEKALS
ncbi:MAG: tetratricopeptide repeat protein [Planctomycetota bacterium]|nr:MAG: tetratricopeptide repeat protein [Planctomycetota bacterium]REK17605.1 MAG: tetratricopeptide repeat protein [Planctomycetota bacterium]REK39811.1 MAG: tetratricopeptide repeat protein [Planctomycetota bacterium]